MTPHLWMPLAKQLMELVWTGTTIKWVVGYQTNPTDIYRLMHLLEIPQLAVYNPIWRISQQKYPPYLLTPQKQMMGECFWRKVQEEYFFCARNLLLSTQMIIRLSAIHVLMFNGIWFLAILIWILFWDSKTIFQKTSHDLRLFISWDLFITNY